MSDSHDFEAVSDSLRETLACHFVGHRGCDDPSADDASELAYQALTDPIDFPALTRAIVPGDHVALAVDPNVPELESVLSGVKQVLDETGAGRITVVLWDEASGDTAAAIETTLGEAVEVIRHDSTQRAALRYLGADETADPIYLNRHLVDADVVLPIVASRFVFKDTPADLTGVFPALADSSARVRCHDQHVAKKGSPSQPLISQGEASWMLGVQLMLCVVPSQSGRVHSVLAGTVDGIASKLSESDQPLAPSGTTQFAVVSLDGQPRHQTWVNAGRAILAATRYVEPGGTIVLWSRIGERISDPAVDLRDMDWQSSPTGSTVLGADSNDDASDWLPPWDDALACQHTLAKVASEYRILIHSDLPIDQIEAMGLAGVESIDDLHRVSEAFEECTILRAAQFS